MQNIKKNYKILTCERKLICFERVKIRMKMHWQILVALGLGAKRNWHIFFAIVLGFIFGIVFPATKYALMTNILFFIGQAFVRLIQMVVFPLITSAILVGIASLGDGRQLGKIGVKMVFYYVLVSLAAVTIGAFLALSLSPGTGITGFIESSKASEIQQMVTHHVHEQKSHMTDMYLNMIPKNPIESTAKGDLVPILIFLIIFGAGLASIGEMGRPIVSFFEGLFAVTMKVTDWIMVLAPPGIFAMTASSVASYGASIFSHVGLFMSIIVVGTLLQLLVVYPLILRIFAKINFVDLYRAVAEAMMVAFGTASSSATLPVTIACCERRAGISNKICSFVLPLGATMNMDGTALFQTVAVIFLTQAYGIPLDPFMVIQIAIFAMIASSTSAGIPGAGIITVALILNSLGLNPEHLIQGFAFLFAIERVSDMFRTLANVTSDTVVAAAVAANENEIDRSVLESTNSFAEVIA